MGGWDDSSPTWAVVDQKSPGQLELKQFEFYIHGVIHRYSRKIFGICHRMCSVKNGATRYFAKCTGKQLCQSLFFNKGLRPATLLKKRLWHRVLCSLRLCFLVNFAKLLRTTLLQNTSGRLFLDFMAKNRK